MISDTKLTFGVATPILSSAFHNTGRSRRATCGSARFCSWPTRISPKEYLSARSAISSISSAVLVVDAQDGLDIAQQIMAVHERFDGFADEGRAAEAAADQHLETGFARVVLVKPQADIVHLDRRAIVIGGGNRKFELTRQE